MSLLDDINDEIATTGRNYGCNACVAINDCTDDETREALSAALAGSMTLRALIRVSAKNDLGFGRTAILRHRDERHTP